MTSIDDDIEYVTTEQAAALLLRKTQTLRKWASTGCGPVQPVRLGRRLGWPLPAIKQLMKG
jgi:hypothetical protein